MNNPIETIQHKGYTIALYYDPEPDNPRVWYNLGTIVYAHRRYVLGDVELNGQPHKHPLPFTNTVDGFDEWCMRQRKQIICLPIYAYEHGAITLRTAPFGDPWESGQVGYIYVTLEELRKTFGWKRITPKRINLATNQLIGEVNTFDQYLRGEVYGYCLMKGDELLDSIWGIYDRNEALKDAKELADYYWKTTPRQLPLPSMEVQ